MPVKGAAKIASLFRPSLACIATVIYRYQLDGKWPFKSDEFLKGPNIRDMPSWDTEMRISRNSTTRVGTTSGVGIASVATVAGGGGGGAGSAGAGADGGGGCGGKAGAVQLGVVWRAHGKGSRATVNATSDDPIRIMVNHNKTSHNRAILVYVFASNATEQGSPAT